VLAALFVGGTIAALPATTGAQSDPARDVTAFRGFGTWVDAYDYSPAFQDGADPPSVTPQSVDDMAALGVKTLYLQAAKADFRSPGPLVDEALVGEFLVRAHKRGIKVVAWYLPLLDDVEADFAHVQAMADFKVKRQRFDALALDVEWIQGVKDVTERNRRLVDLVGRTRALVGDEAGLGGIVFPAVQLEVINPSLWPGFPYRELRRDVDVWMPMAYWTFRNAPYRDPASYTGESIRRLRAALRDDEALVHPIGGIGDLSSAADYESFLQSVRDEHAVGWSIYDFNTTLTSAWPRLRSRAGLSTTTTAPTTTTTTTTTTRRSAKTS
jgi:hypothetical protein